MSPPDVTIDLCHARPAVQLVIEFEDPGGMVDTFWPEEGLSVCEMWLTMWRKCCSTHTGSGLCYCDVEVMVCPLHYLWTSGGLPVVSQNFLGNGYPGWYSCGCVLTWPGLAHHYVKCTLPALAASSRHD